MVMGYWVPNYMVGNLLFRQLEPWVRGVSGGLGGFTWGGGGGCQGDVESYVYPESPIPLN